MKLTDTQVYDLLHAALLALGRDDGITATGDTALKTARRALGLLQASVLIKIDEAEKDATSGQDGASAPPHS